MTFDLTQNRRSERSGGGKPGSSKRRDRENETMIASGFRYRVNIRQQLRSWGIPILYLASTFGHNGNSKNRRQNGGFLVKNWV